MSEDFVPAALRPALVRGARLQLAGYALLALASLAAGSGLLLWLWVVPVLLGQPFLRLYLLAEHSGCPEVPDMLANSRTPLTNPLLRALCWNMNLHSAHHANPAVRSEGQTSEIQSLMTIPYAVFYLYTNKHH